MLNVESGIAKGRTGGTSGVTNEELERGMELHERRLAAIDERLDRLAAASESHDKRLRRVEDNLVVQGEMLNRIDQRLDRLTALFEQSEAAHAADRERIRLLQAAMASLFEHMEAFIRGLRPNGHEDHEDKAGDA